MEGVLGLRRLGCGHGRSIMLSELARARVVVRPSGVVRAEGSARRGRAPRSLSALRTAIIDAPANILASPAALGFPPNAPTPHRAARTPVPTTAQARTRLPASRPCLREKYVRQFN